MTKSSLYHYRECGLDNIYLVNGFELVETPRGQGALIKDVPGLHRAIGQMLVREKKALSGREFRFLRHELNLTQQSLAAIMRVDTQTVARWEKRGTEEVDGPASSLIRVMYEEKINGNRDIIEPLQKLAELDEILELDDVAFEFEDQET